MLLALVALVGGVTVGIASDVSDSLDELKTGAPEAAAELEQRYDWLAEIELAERVNDFVDDLDERSAHDAVSQIVGTVPTYLVTGILMLFLLAYGRRTSTRSSPSSTIRDGATPSVRCVTESRRSRAPLPPRRDRQRDRQRRRRRARGWALDLPAAASLGVAVGALTCCR